MEPVAVQISPNLSDIPARNDDILICQIAFVEKKKQTFSMYEIILLINSYKKDPQILVQSCIKFPTT